MVAEILDRVLRREDVSGDVSTSGVSLVGAEGSWVVLLTTSRSPASVTELNSKHKPQNSMRLDFLGDCFTNLNLLEYPVLGARAMSMPKKSVTWKLVGKISEIAWSRFDSHFIYIRHMRLQSRELQETTKELQSARIQ